MRYKLCARSLSDMKCYGAYSQEITILWDALGEELAGMGRKWLQISFNSWNTCLLVLMRETNQILLCAISSYIFLLGQAMAL